MMYQRRVEDYEDDIKDGGLTLNPNLTSELNGSDLHRECYDWSESAHPLFKVAMVLFLVAYITPDTYMFRYKPVVFRILVALGTIPLLIWASIVVCYTDLWSWNLVYLIANLLHFIIVGIMLYPAGFPKELEHIYAKLFKPFKVSRTDFKEFAARGSLLELDSGYIYAMEQVTAGQDKLSILISGKIRVSYERLILHYIEPNQFLDSIEYEVNNSDDSTKDTFQVSLTAEEPCLIYTWPSGALNDHLKANPFLGALLNKILGKDITMKLYQVQYMMANPESMRLVQRRNSSMVNVRSAIFRRNSVLPPQLGNFIEEDETFPSTPDTLHQNSNNHQSHLSFPIDTNDLKCQPSTRVSFAISVDSISSQGTTDDENIISNGVIDDPKHYTFGDDPKPDRNSQNPSHYSNCIELKHYSHCNDPKDNRDSDDLQHCECDDPQHHDCHDPKHYKDHDDSNDYRDSDDPQYYNCDDSQHFVFSDPQHFDCDHPHNTDSDDSQNYMDSDLESDKGSIQG
ncbi:unnamed protein product [Owenia fusiformis]|uniref:POPDC1-3 domain-containing protein n=1 Tax=Owenia fusiformis TaxID=6347 RepID=A0A8J1TAJ0_OWEFU|nr:unnamed protein product [Owenia fusiformis]